jgi:NDP-sugar pyrophosphorylase family protein
MKEIRAMVLAAGFGTRMQKAGEQRPKPLVELAGQPLIKYPIALIRQAGFDEVIINLHHRSQEIKEKIGDGRGLGIKIKYITEPEILGTGGGVKNAHRLFPARKWLTINADTVLDLNLKNLLLFHDRLKPLATMVLTRWNEKFTPVFADNLARVKRIDGFPEKISPEKTLSIYAFTGVQVVSSQMLDYLPQGFSKMVEQGYFQALAKDDPVFAYYFQGLWLTFDDPDSISMAQARYADQLKRKLA